MNEHHRELLRAARAKVPALKDLVWAWDPVHLDDGYADGPYPDDYDELVRLLAFQLSEGAAENQIVAWLVDLLNKEWEVVATELEVENFLDKTRSVV